MDLVVPTFEKKPWLAPGWTRGPTAHLTWAELDCKDGTPYPDEWKIERAIPLAHEFEIVRATVSDIVGSETPISIGSGYRTRSHNRNTKGSRRSMHLVGKAIDLWTPKGVGLLDLLDVVIAVARRDKGRIRGIGCYPWGIHIDIRHGERIARWKGNRVAPEVEKRIASV